jgi:hypothetical protein
MNKYIIFSLLLTSVLFSCKKDDEPASQKTYLSKEIFPSTGMRTWTYDAQNKLTNIAFASNNETSNPSFNFRVQKLDAADRVTEAVIDYNDVTKTDIKIVNTFNADGKMISETEYNAATLAQLSSWDIAYTTTEILMTYKNGAGVLQFNDVYTLSTDGKNKIKWERTNASGVLQLRDVYSGFDDKKSPQSVFVPGWSIVPSNANNFTTDSLTNASGSTYGYTYTYEYNSDGYTTKRTSASGAVSTYEYTKK